jgi:hypothetical protein
MDDANSNVISLASRKPVPQPLPPEAPPLFIPLTSLGAVTKALDQVEVVVELAQRVLSKVDKYGEAMTLAGVQQVLEALARLLNQIPDDPVVAAE